MSKIKDTHIVQVESYAMGVTYKSFQKIHVLENGTFFIENNKGTISQMPSGDDRNEHLRILNQIGYPQ